MFGQAANHPEVEKMFEKADKKMDEAWDELNEYIQSLKNAAATLRFENVGLEDSVRIQKKAIFQMKERIEELQKDPELLQNRVEHLESELSQEKHAVANLVGQRERARLRENTLKRDIREVADRNRNQVETINALGEANDNLNKNVSYWFKRATKLKKKLQKAKRKNAGLVETIYKISIRDLP